MVITDDEIRWHSNATELDRAIKECFDLFRKLEMGKAEFIAHYDIQREKMLATLGHMQGIRLAMKTKLGV
jgi:hypothetical protein